MAERDETRRTQCGGDSLGKVVSLVLWQQKSSRLLYSLGLLLCRKPDLCLFCICGFFLPRNWNQWLTEITLRLVLFPQLPLVNGMSGYGCLLTKSQEFIQDYQL